MTETLRADYIEGLRQLATWLESNPDVDLPADGTRLPLGFTEWGNDARDKARAWAKAFPGKLDKHVDDYYYRLRGKLAGLDIEFVAYRDEICEKVVIGQREIVEEVPDPEYDVPMVERVKVVEDVEWRCPPLLAEVVET